MIPDLKFIEHSFNRFNALIFSSNLPTPRFRITRARTFRGKLVYRIRKHFAKVIYEDFEIRISINFDLPVEEWEDVVIHEMIHLHIASSYIKDTSVHGLEFRKIMHHINRKHNRHIVLSAKSDPENTVINADRRVKAHFICLARFADGRLGIASVAKTRIFDLSRRFKKFPGVVALKWLGSTDTWFNSLPHVIKPKFYIMKEEAVLPHLKGGRPIVFEGQQLRVLNRLCSPDELLP